MGRGCKAIKLRLIAHKFEMFEDERAARKKKVLVNRWDHLSSSATRGRIPLASFLL
jgi:hypothetical protein